MENSSQNTNAENSPEQMQFELNQTDDLVSTDKPKLSRVEQVKAIAEGRKAPPVDLDELPDEAGRVPSRSRSNLDEIRDRERVLSDHRQ